MTDTLTKPNNPTANEEDNTEAIRLERLAQINAEPEGREALAAQYGRVWDTRELTAEFEVVGFMAPYVVVRRKADRQQGSLEFQHQPRFYFHFITDSKES